MPDDRQPDLLATIRETAVDRELSALDPVIGMRQTNRRRFASGEVPPDVVAAPVAAADLWSCARQRDELDASGDRGSITSTPRRQVGESASRRFPAGRKS